MDKNTNILDRIVETKHAELEALKAIRPLESLQKETDNFKTERRPFQTLFEKGPVLIAEIKPRSPSVGELISDSPLEIADMYAKSDADVISVLTDADYFGGSNALLQEVRARVPQAILRKDFIIDEYQVYETLLLKADVYLLIAAILTKEELAKLIELGESLGLDALVEVHDEGDIEKALSAGAKIIGINNRDLTTFDVSLQRSLELRQFIPPAVLAVSESGIRTHNDVAQLKAAGFDAILVGEGLVTRSDKVSALKELIED